MFTKFLFPANKNYVSTIWKTVAPLKLLPTYENCNVVPNLEIVRFRARKGTRAAKLAEKKARKLANASKPSPIPKYLQRKTKVSAELQRTRCVDENWLESQPVDNVWNMRLYRGKPYTCAEALQILQDLHIPSLLNDPSAYVFLTAELDLKLKKKDKYMNDFVGVITYPNEFEPPKRNKIIAICNEEADQQKATEAGALYAGSKTLVKQILQGVLSSEEFDYIICHPDMYKELNSLRGILKHKYPTMHNGLLRLDVDRGVANFIKGIEYKLKRSALELDFGWVDLCFGRLNMSLEELEGNIKHALQTIEKHKPPGTSHILFNVRSLLWCEKSRERFKIPHWEYLPNYPENGILVEEKEDEESHG